MHKKYRLVLFSNASSSVKEFKFSKFHIFLIAGTCLAVFSAVTAVSVSVLLDLLYSYKLNSLQQEKSAMRESIMDVTYELENLSYRVSELYEDDELFRSELNLVVLDPSKKEFGIGGSSNVLGNQSDFFFSEQELLSDNIKKISQLKFQVDLSEKSYAFIYSSLKQHKEELRYLPSIVPVQQGEGKIYLNDGFGMRDDPFKTGGDEFHYGIDIRGAIGTPVYATADGEIMEVDKVDRSEQGKYVKISHYHKKYGYITKYFHLSRIEPEIRKGAEIKRWQKIGEIGETGIVTGPHLHYEIELWGERIDPVKRNWRPDIFLPFLVEETAGRLKNN